MSKQTTIPAEIQAMEAETEFAGFKVSYLRKVFDKMADPDDWKAPIAASMPEKLVNAATAAVDYFTAAGAHVDFDPDTGRYIVTSVGYREGPAGP